MRIAVLEPQALFAPGAAGAALAARLCEELVAGGHEVARIRVPFRGADPRTIVDQLLAARLLRADGAQRAIGLGFPAHLVPHEERIAWVLDEYAPAALPAGAPGAAVARAARSAARNADRVHLAGARAVYARSPAGAAWLAAHAGLRSEVLYPPPCAPAPAPAAARGARTDAPGPLAVFVAPSRAPEVLVALAGARAAPRCALAAPAPAHGPLRELAEALGVGERVELLATPLGPHRRAELVAAAPAAICGADERDPGALLDALAAGTPVIALAGACAAPPGAHALARDGAQLTAALDALAGDPGAAARAGRTALEAGRTITWARVVAELTA